ncbi:hypothetical protein B0H63DRAFT_182200 [Podospora didyma]|uniref:Uncharacterized protein n=1 Tax=Podospora didyma TaxID=330526 RepID=A0AAE0NPM5_9PEZI|nr:hypothetical protein B0H63DRAFT_182200 [Podospora didyma]
MLTFDCWLLFSFSSASLLMSLSMSASWVGVDGFLLLFLIISLSKFLFHLVCVSVIRSCDITSSRAESWLIWNIMVDSWVAKYLGHLTPIEKVKEYGISLVVYGWASIF